MNQQSAAKNLKKVKLTIKKLAVSAEDSSDNITGGYTVTKIISEKERSKISKIALIHVMTEMTS